MGRQPAAVWRKSLQRRILLPFFLVMLLAGAVVTGGTGLDIATTYRKGVDDRLQAFQNTLYREIKNQEHLLVTYASLLEYMRPAETGTAGVSQDELYNSLNRSNISVALYPAAAREVIPYESLKTIIEQAQQSGRPRFRLATDHGPTPYLVVAAASFTSAAGDVMVLQTPFDRNFLGSMAADFRVVPHLLGMDGALLLAGDSQSRPPELAAAELAIVLAGKPLLTTADGRRYLFQAIPLGTTDLVIAVAEAPLHEIDASLQSLTLRSAAFFVFALFVGLFLYRRLTRQITQGLGDILRATAEVGAGNLAFRLSPRGDDEIGKIAGGFNAMLETIETRRAEELARQREISAAESEERHRELLDRKNLEIALTSEECKAQEKELAFLLQTIQATNSLQDASIYLERMIELGQKQVACQNLLLLLHHPGAEDLEVRKMAGPAPERFLGLKFRVDIGFTGRAVKLQEMIYLNDLKTDNLHFHYRGGSIPGGSLVCSPIATNGRLAGLLILQKEEAHAFTETELKLTQVLTWQLAVGLEIVRLQEWIHGQSTIDDLTGLTNRRFFQDILKRELSQAQRYGSEFSLLMLDLDHFKIYNDTQGNLGGDTVLKQVANILLQNTRGIDLVARFGADRFSILLPKTDKSGAFKAAEKLRQCIAEADFPGTADCLPAGRLTVSIGISGYPSDSRDLYDIIDLSDRALRAAKDAGRNCCHFWQRPAPVEPIGRYPVIS